MLRGNRGSMRTGQADRSNGFAGVSGEDFRDALARWASGVTIVTARDEDGPVGMTAASFSSLSLDPPLVLVCVARSAEAHDGLVGAEGFAIHILGSRQEELSVLFAQAGNDKFEGLGEERGPFGAPLLPFGLARLCCAHEAGLDGGDHTILVGRVLSTELAGDEPLVYWDRRYHILG